MSTHFRPAIQNGKVTRRSAALSHHRPARHQTGRASIFQWPHLTSAISLPGGLSNLTDIGAWWHTSLTFFGLDRHRIEENTVSEAAGSRSWVLVTLLACGALLAGGFVFSLRDRFTTHAFVKEEVKLKSQFDQTRSEKRFLEASLSRAASLTEISRAALQSGAINPIHLDRRQTPKTAASGKPHSTNPKQ